MSGTWGKTWTNAGNGKSRHQFNCTGYQAVHPTQALPSCVINVTECFRDPSVGQSQPLPDQEWSTSPPWSLKPMPRAKEANIATGEFLNASVLHAACGGGQEKKRWRERYGSFESYYKLCEPTSVTPTTAMTMESTMRKDLLSWCLQAQDGRLDSSNLIWKMLVRGLSGLSHCGRRTWTTPSRHWVQ